MKKKDLPPEHVAEEELLERIDELQQTTEQIEAEKEAKKLAREEKKFLKEHAKKRKKVERFIAPILFIITLIISYFIYARNK